MRGPRGRTFKSNKPTQKPAVGAAGAAGRGSGSQQGRLGSETRQWVSRLSWPCRLHRGWISSSEQGNTRRGSKQGTSGTGFAFWKDPLTLPADVWEGTADPEGPGREVETLTELGWGLVQVQGGQGEWRPGWLWRGERGTDR